MTNQNASPAEFAVDQFGFSVQISGPVDNALPVLTAEEDARAVAREDLAQAERLPGRAVTLTEFFADHDKQEAERFNLATDGARKDLNTAISKLEAALNAVLLLEETNQAVGVLTPGEALKVLEASRSIFKHTNILKGVRASLTRPVPSGIDGSDVRREDSKPGQREEQF